jgi:hypothetical protein
VLAVAGTLLASSATLGAALWSGHWEYLLISSSVGPLLLFRTPASTQIGIRLFMPVIDRFRRWLPAGMADDDRELVTLWAIVRDGVRVCGSLLANVSLHALYYVCVLIWSVVVRVVASALALVKHPLLSISAISSNFREVCFVTDITRELELIPGLVIFPHGPMLTRNLIDPPGSARMTFRNLFLLLFRPNSPERRRTSTPASDLIPPHWNLRKRLLVYASITPIVLLLVIPLAVPTLLILMTVTIAHVLGWWYRFSLKSTAVVWLPALYMAYDIAPRGWTVNRRLQAIRYGVGAWIMRIYALVVALALAVKFVLWYVWYKSLVALVNDYELLKVVSPVVRPIDVPVWQICSFLNAVAAWVLLWYADRELRNRQFEEGWPDRVEAVS